MEWLMRLVLICRIARPTQRLWLIPVTAIVLSALPPQTLAEPGSRNPDPAQVVPLDQIAPQFRGSVVEVIREHTFHHQGQPETFPCSESLYRGLLEEPLVPLALWKNLSDSPMQLHKVGPGHYEGNDGLGGSTVFDFVVRDRRLHVLLASFTHVSPRSQARIDARMVLIVHSAYVRDSKKEPCVKHDVEVFVKVDSRGWKALARTLRPLVERILEDRVREAGHFVSVMSRIVSGYPDWACQVVSAQPAIDTVIRQRFRDVVTRSRKPGASQGRPIVAQTNPPAAGARTRSE
jgi:hypothetical protein